jgi:transposase InsO family protein
MWGHKYEFINWLPRTPRGNDSIWLIVDRLTKVAHFIPVRTMYGGDKLVKLYIDNILKLHGVPKSIISDREAQFVSKFWRSLHQALKTKLDFSSAYHHQTDGQTERVNQVLEDMLRACVLTYNKNWEDSLAFAMFSYNNRYHTSLKKAPLRYFMEGSAARRWCGQKSETVSLKARTLLKLPKKRYQRPVRICG